ncbi:amino acid transporter [Suillus clintonianus]|uniref:amino acid transporter n=1 Tax=Suillus clintonianus TaxID=1904413 RepID=UPI001B8840E1|nr:amino acid transporter [Suillus clintonianus]KAG2151409.1 amino acid transporter [Suillus clintonianus]
MPNHKETGIVTVTESTRDSQDDVPLVHQKDNILLRKLGYKSEFKREFSLLETISFSMAILAVSCGITTGYSYPLLSGGHFAMVWGWFIACIFVMCVAASMAELASSMPTSAGLYYFSAKMASKERSALASWITGWSNITGQVTLICSINFSCTELVTTAIAMGTDGAVVLGSGATFGILMGIHLTQAIFCSAGTRILARMTVVTLVLIMTTTIGAIVSLLVCAGDQRVSSKDAWTKFENNTGWSNSKYVWAFILAFTSPMWSLTGYDSAAHIAEETAGAARAAPIAILVGVAGTEILGWLYYIAASYATASVPDILQTKLALPLGQVFLNVLGKKGALTLWCSIAYLCGCSQAVDASRVIFAFSRDNALPGSRWWKRINHKTQTPVNAVWFAMLLSAICGVLVFSTAAFNSLASASVIGLYISYVTPIYCRVTWGKDKLQPGPFSLGWWSFPIGWIGIVWVAFMVVMLLFPYTQTANVQTMNYSIVIVMAVFIFAGGSWIFSARHWFTGPIPNVDETDSSSYSEKPDNTEHNSLEI